MGHKSEFDEVYFVFFKKLYESCEKNSREINTNNSYGITKPAIKRKDREFNKYINKFLISELSKYN